MKQDLLIPCRTCDHMISGNAYICPNCGESAPVKQEEVKKSPDPNLHLPCCVCNHTITKYTESCPNCGEPDPYRGAIKKWREEKSYKEKYVGIKNNLQLIFPIIYLVLFVVYATWIDLWHSLFPFFTFFSMIWIPIHFIIWWVKALSGDGFDFPFVRVVFYENPVGFTLFWGSTYLTIPAIGTIFDIVK